MIRYNRFSEGGHFAALETPETMANDMKQFLRRLSGVHEEIKTVRMFMLPRGREQTAKLDRYCEKTELGEQQTASTVEAITLVRKGSFFIIL